MVVVGPHLVPEQKHRGEKKQQDAMEGFKAVDWIISYLGPVRACGTTRRWDILIRPPAEWLASAENHVD
jgi:hypothetical protein